MSALPADLAASVFIVTHVPVHGAMLLAGLLAARTELPVSYAEDGGAILPGRIVIARPDRHLLVTDDRIRLGVGPRENLSRPAIDALFRSAALAHGRRVTGVILTGMLNDGAAGLFAIKQVGGVTIVQDPATASAPGMPRTAIATANPDHVVASRRSPPSSPPFPARRRQWADHLPLNFASGSRPPPGRRSAVGA